MYAVIETGGKQYRVEVGTQLEVERLEAEAGESITFERVLLVADGDQAAIGQPLVADAEVSAEVVRRDRGEKLLVFKYRPKARRRVKKGHRQELTVLRISDIVFDGKSAAEDVRKADEAAAADRQRLEDAAARQAAEDAALAAKLAARTAPKAETTTEARTTGRRKAARPRPAAEREVEPEPESPEADSPEPEPRVSGSAQAAAPASAAKAGGRAGSRKAGRKTTSEPAEGETTQGAEETKDASPRRSRTKKDE